MLQQEDERSPVNDAYANLRSGSDGEVILLCSTLSEDEDMDMDFTDYSHYASTGAADLHACACAP